MTRINVMAPWVGEAELEAVAEVLGSGWLAQGPRVRAFEDAFAGRQQAGHAVALSSCTAALHLGLLVAGVGPGDEVVVPSWSFVATTNCVRYVGATPVFCDVERETGNVSASTIEPVLSERTRAVIAVDQGGTPLDLDPIRALCDPQGVLVFEDAACAVGSTYRGRPVGAGADLAAWSFHPRKIMTTGEGGMLTSSRADWAARAGRLREHAMSVSAAERHASVLAPPECYDEVGFNYRMTDLQAAIGLVQLRRLDAMVERRRELAARYAAALATIPGLRPITDPPYGTSNVQSYWVEVTPDYPLSRDGLLEALADADISARRGFMAAHRQPPYRDLPAHLPVTDVLTDATLILPLHHQLTLTEQIRVVEVLSR